MNKFDNVPRNDTVLNTGLLAIAIAWVALAAIRGPVTPARDVTSTLAPAAAHGGTDIAGARNPNPAAAGRTIGSPRVS